MNDTIKLAPRQSEVTRYIAWGATKKDVANILNMPIRTVENTLRRVFAKTGVTKVNELAAWFFCHEYNISMDLSPIKRQITSMAMMMLIVFELFNFDGSEMRVRRTKSGKKTETELILES